MSQQIIELLKQGTQNNLSDAQRDGNVVHLSGPGELIATGDLHGNRANFNKIVQYADLEANPRRHVVLQEILHGGRMDEQGGCLSYELLFEAVRFQLRFPGRVHIIMGNHDTAVVSGNDVLKNGKEMNRAMHAAMERSFGDDFQQVEQALRDYIFSQPLAVRTSNRLWMSHSLPADRFLDRFDSEIFHRPLEPDDMTRPHSAYLLTWGRRHSEDTLHELAGKLEVDVFILGHQPQEQGWAQVADNTLIIASEHNHGCILPIDLSTTYTVEELIDNIVSLAAVALN